MPAHTVTIVSAAMVATLSSAFWVAVSSANRAVAPAFEDGVVHVKTGYPLADPIARIRQDIAAKGMMFSTIDQAMPSSHGTPA
jgi:hypothetical protein